MPKVHSLKPISEGGIAKIVQKMLSKLSSGIKDLDARKQERRETCRTKPQSQVTEDAIHVTKNVEKSVRLQIALIIILPNMLLFLKTSQKVCLLLIDENCFWRNLHEL